MVKYLINDTTTYRVSTIEDVEALHEELKNDPTFELGSFSYKTKQVKAKGEIIDEYVLVTAKKLFNAEKEPTDLIDVKYEKENFEASF